MIRIDEQITLRKLEALLAFMQTGNLAQAGEALGTSAVSVHRALHSLEQAMRCALFRHEGRQLVALESAQVLAEVAREVVCAIEQGVRATREAGGYSANHIRIGSLYSLTLRLVPQVVTKLKVRKPDLRTELVLSSNADLLHRLHHGSVDAALLALPVAAQDVESWPMFEDELLFASPPDWRTLPDAEVDLRVHVRTGFVSLGEEFATSKSMHAAFAAAGYTPRIVMRTGDIFSLMSLVRGGIGCALLPARVKEVFLDRIQWRALAPAFRVRQRIGLAFLKARERDPNILSILSVCRMLGRSLALA